MKKSQLLQIVREEIRSVVKEYGQELLYFQPAGIEQIDRYPQTHTRRFDNFEKWKITALQQGATIHDRGEDYVAVLTNQDKLGVFSKASKMGTLNY
jgi:hypothetical protein